LRERQRELDGFGREKRGKLQKAVRITDKKWNLILLL